MTSKERVLKAFEHKNADRVPMDFGGLTCSTLHVNCIAALREYYGLPKKPITLIEPYMMIGAVDDDLAEVLHIDTYGVVTATNLFGATHSEWEEWTTPHGIEVLVGKGFKTSCDDNGGYYAYANGDTNAPPSGYMPKDSFYFDFINRPSDGRDDYAVEENTIEFTPYPKEVVDHYAREVAKAPKDKFITTSFGGTALGDITNVALPWEPYPTGLRNQKDWIMTVFSDPDFVRGVFDYETDVAIENLKNLPQEIKDGIDGVLTCGTDFGMQNGLFYSVETFKSVFAPYYRKLNDWIHKNLGWKVIKHSCGDNYPMFPHLAEAGFDAVNPIQCSAKDMEPRRLKKEFGKDIVFWGGGIDTQQVLPFGKPEDVRKQVLERLEIFSPDGGYVFNAIHNVQPRTPVENLVAMFDAVNEFNGLK